MKPFRHILVTAVLTLSVFACVLYTSCKNKCGGTTCQNGGTCSDNVCQCPVGYSGNACQIGWSDAVVGTYTCSRDNCSPAVIGVNSWQSAVTKDATNSGFTIDINNFDNSGTLVAVATIDSGDGVTQKITISPAVGSFGVNGDGTYTIATGTINLSYTTSTPTGIGGYHCNMVMKKE